MNTHDIKTSAGGRSYVAEYFCNNMGRYDFTDYIHGRLAADFACALAQHLSQVENNAAKRVREALEQAYAKLDEIGAQLQQAREDRNDDYWSGVGAMVEAAEEAIRALIPKQ